MTHTLRIFGEPVANQSPRSKIARKADGSQFVHVYPATIVEDWQKCVIVQLAVLRSATDIVILDGALRIELWAYLTRSKSSTLMYPERKPDFDNLVKPVVDCLEKSRIIKNDSRIVEAHVYLRWAYYHYPDDPQSEEEAGIIFKISQIDTSQRKELNKLYGIRKNRRN